jgi:PQQ-dependent catabolism-associated CXXCW motif protein
MEDADFGGRPTRYLEVPNPTRPLPKTVPGVTTLTTLELRQLLNAQPGVVLVDAYSEGAHMSLPGALWRPDIGLPRPGAFPLADMQKAMAAATGNDRDRPVVVFERSSAWGWYGYNAALRLLGMGYTNVLWYRGGVDAWFDAGFPMARLTTPTMVAR